MSLRRGFRLLSSSSMPVQADGSYLLYDNPSLKWKVRLFTVLAGGQCLLWTTWYLDSKTQAVDRLYKLCTGKELKAMREIRRKEEEGPLMAFVNRGMLSIGVLWMATRFYKYNIVRFSIQRGFRTINFQTLSFLGEPRTHSLPLSDMEGMTSYAGTFYATRRLSSKPSDPYYLIDTTQGCIHNKEVLEQLVVGKQVSPSVFLGEREGAREGDVGKGPRRIGGGRRMALNN